MGAVPEGDLGAEEGTPWGGSFQLSKRDIFNKQRCPGMGVPWRVLSSLSLETLNQGPHLLSGEPWNRSFGLSIPWGPWQPDCW